MQLIEINVVRIHQEFINPARNDGLVLKHWVKQSEADNQGTDERGIITQYINM